MNKEKIIGDLESMIAEYRIKNVHWTSVENAIKFLKELPDYDLGNLPKIPPDWFYRIMSEYFNTKSDISSTHIWEEIVGRLSKPVNPIEPKWYEKLKYNQRFVNELWPTHHYYFSALELCIKSTCGRFIPVRNCSSYTPPPPTTDEIISKLKASLTEEQKKLVEQIPYQFVKLK